MERSLVTPLWTRLLPFAACVGVVVGLRTSGLGVGAASPSSATIALGLLLVGGFVAGQAAAAIRLPRITGYLLFGLVSGPGATELLSGEMLAAGKVVESIAVALIALTAGGEIELAWLRREIRRIATITAVELSVVAVVISAILWLGRALFPFMPVDDPKTAVVIAAVFGAIAVANSPTVTIAVIGETRAEGPVSRTIMGVTVFKDVCVIVLFAATLAIARGTLGSGAETSLAWTLTREIGGSVLAGIVFGAAIAWYLQHVRRDLPAFLLVACYGMGITAAGLHLETLLVALSAGFWVQNFSGGGAGAALIRGIERVSLPVYAVFFAAAGTKVDLGALADLWPLALLLVVSRALAVWGGTALGVRLSGADPGVARWGWLGLISQAGVSLALASLVARQFPGWGESIQVLIIAMIAVHELIGPIGFQIALTRVGEVGRAGPAG